MLLSLLYFTGKLYFLGMWKKTLTYFKSNIYLDFLEYISEAQFSKDLLTKSAKKLENPRKEEKKKKLGYPQ